MKKKKKKVLKKKSSRIFLLPDGSPIEDRVVKVINTTIVDSNDPPKQIDRLEVERTRSGKVTLVNRQYYRKGDGAYYYGKALGFTGEDLSVILGKADALDKLLT